MAFKKGESGNPAGRTPGMSHHHKLRLAIAKDLPSIIEAMVTQAKAGDVQAARLLVDKVLPSMKPVDQAVALPLAGVDLGADGRAILSATGDAAITPEQAGRLLAGLGSLARVIETDELLKRIEKLEAANATAKN
jgi:hypothetical protein